MKNTIEAFYVKRVPKGCPSFDVVHLRMTNAFGKNVELYFTPDEAMLVANHLLGASLEAVCDDPHFRKRFITARMTYANKKKKD